jgi:hypothetical protein
MLLKGFNYHRDSVQKTSSTKGPSHANVVNFQGDILIQTEKNLICVTGGGNVMIHIYISSTYLLECGKASKHALR